MFIKNRKRKCFFKKKINENENNINRITQKVEEEKQNTERKFTEIEEQTEVEVILQEERENLDAH